jgi:hypothetical protein
VFLADQAQQVRLVAGLDLSGIQVDLAPRRLADRIAAETAEIVQGMPPHCRGLTTHSAS